MILSSAIAAAIALCAILVGISHAQDQTQEVSNSIAADSLYVRLVGGFNPREDDVFFISSLQITFDDYYQTTYTNTLYGFDIAAIFIYPAIDESNNATNTTSWCEIQTTFSIPTDIDSSTFNTEVATQFVMDFFSSMEQSAVLLKRLNKTSNISISTIEVFSRSSDTVRTELKGYIDIPSSSSFPSSSLSSSSSDSRILKVLAIVSGTIICVAAVALILSTLLRGHDTRKNNIGDRQLGITKRDANTGSISFPIDEAKTMNEMDQTFSDIEDESENQYHGEHVVTLCDSDEQPQQDEICLNRGDLPIISSESFSIDFDNESNMGDEETVVTRNQVSPTTSQFNSPTTTNTSSNGSPIWSLLSGNSTDPTTSPYSTEEILHKRYRWHDSDADDDVDISQLLSLPEEPRSPGSSSYESSKCDTNNESDATSSSTSHDS
jgi:hypothetical protein